MPRNLDLPLIGIVAAALVVALVVAPVSYTHLTLPTTERV